MAVAVATELELEVPVAVGVRPMADTCTHLTNEQIDALLEERLPADEAAQLYKKLETCETCRNLYEQREEVHDREDLARIRKYEKPFLKAAGVEDWDPVEAARRVLDNIKDKKK